MTRISEIGDQILSAQAARGLPNPQHLNSGLSSATLNRFFAGLDVRPSELQDLFAWRNGSIANSEIPMAQIWIKPGFFLLSVEDALEENAYLLSRESGWSRHWYPLLSDGAADRHFFDISQISGRLTPVFYSFPESRPAVGRIYDSLELMLLSILKCYEQNAYFIDEDGLLASHAAKEAEICVRINPRSDYWRRGDLF